MGPANTVFESRGKLHDGDFRFCPQFPIKRALYHRPAESEIPGTGTRRVNVDDAQLRVTAPLEQLASPRPLGCHVSSIDVGRTLPQAMARAPDE